MIATIVGKTININKDTTKKTIAKAFQRLKNDSFSVTFVFFLFLSLLLIKESYSIEINMAIINIIAVSSRFIKNNLNNCISINKIPSKKVNVENLSRTGIKYINIKNT